MTSLGPVCFALVLLACASLCSVAYNLRVPLNGGMYGKRESPAEYDTRSKVMSTMCEMVSEVCSAWLAQADPN